MLPANALMKGLQRAWENYPESKAKTFQEALDIYANYYSHLPSKQQESLSRIFWQKIKEFGTPIIEGYEGTETQCYVYFLLPKDQLKNSNDLYLQGEFHGYSGIRDRNKLQELSNTGIMYRKDIMPRNAMVTYQYQQVDAPSPEDHYSSHRTVYHGYPGSIIFRVNPELVQSHLGKREEQGYWERAISSASPNSSKYFNYHATLYSDLAGKLQQCDAPLPKKVDIYNPVPDKAEVEDLSDSPYGNFTRAVHIFKPASHKIDNVIVFNDGRPYILAGVMEHMEKMVNAKLLTPNTAFVFINPLQGLAKIMPEIQTDERFKLSGMGVRMIDFDKGINNYIAFLEKLFQQLAEQGINIPNAPSNRVMVGSSLSGTASIYMALKNPQLFSGIIAQSPSPSNDEILKGVEINREANIQLSCGIFEQPSYHDVDTNNVEYANKLADRFRLTCHQSCHGHNHAAWVVNLDQSLPIF